jgi:glutamyl-tRNA synthetase
MLMELTAKLTADFPRDHESFDRLIQDFAASKHVKMGAVAQPLRLALTGETASPGLYDIIEILGPDRTIKRAQAAVNCPNPLEIA